ncbi:DUF397 domain-containing protein [Actinomadura citrea]|uniref:DUF397 domain-containing protein n=1 Tax=Actinomadura citrea TaxID=46158 RepID=UPI002E2AF9E3|nr:DUF397 domain-containing protein [Actinomadura citrea]
MTNPPVWRKSSRSTQGTSEQCVELAQLPHAVGIRDSKAPGAGHLTLTPHAFADLVTRAKRDSLPR